MGKNNQRLAPKILNASGSVFYLKTLRSPLARTNIQVHVFIRTIVEHLLYARDLSIQAYSVSVGSNSSAGLDQTGPVPNIQ